MQDELARLRREVEEARSASVRARSNTDDELDRMREAVAAAKAAKAASAGAPASAVHRESEIERLRRELEAARAVSSPAASCTTSQLEQLRAQVEAAKAAQRLAAHGASAGAPASAVQRESEIERLRRELEAARAVSSPAASSTTSRLEQLRAQVEAAKAAKRFAAMGASSGGAAGGGAGAVVPPSAVQRESEIERLRQEIARMNAASSVPASSTNSTLEHLRAQLDQARGVDSELEKLRKEAEALKQFNMMPTVIADDVHKAKEHLHLIQEATPDSRVIRQEAEKLHHDVRGLGGIAPVSDPELERLRKAVAEKKASAHSAPVDPEMERKKAELERLRQINSVRSSVSKDPEIQALRDEIGKLVRDGATPEELSRAHAKLHQQEQVLQNREKTVDVCFLIDVTGSMGRYIEAAKQKVVEIAREFSHQGLVIRMAFVGYRDFGDDPCLEVLDFVEDARELQAFLSHVEADGGGDYPEDVLGGLERCLSLSWGAKTRLVIHVADAPCHGTEYHVGFRDDHPNGDPSGRRPEDVLREFVQSKYHIDYYFAKVEQNDDGSYDTDIMTDKFRQVYESSGTNRKFKCLEMGSNPADFMFAVRTSVTASMAGKKMVGIRG